MISRLEPVKGHAFLLTAMRDLVRNGETRLRLFIAGEGRQEAALRQMVKDHDLGAYVHFAGFRSDISAILGAIDLFCLPSLTEGLPFAVLEACRQGVPVLASRLPSAADLFTDDQTIFFTPIGDAEALRQRLATILAERSSLRRVGDAGRSLIERDLLIGPMVETTLGVYRAAISKACPT
jgi:glycosyltransferase involved in cell wall biosynthesis